MKGPVICGIDDSRTTRGAVAVARELARRYELPLLYVHVLDGHDGRRQRRPVAPTDAELALVGGHPAVVVPPAAVEPEIEGGIVRFGPGA